MPKLITIKAPTDAGTKDVEGYLVRLYVGAKQERFLLQHEPTGEVVLTHYDSGMRVGSLSPIKLRYARSYRRITDRAAAVELLNELVEKHGQERVWNVMQNAPVLN